MISTQYLVDGDGVAVILKTIGALKAQANNVGTEVVQKSANDLVEALREAISNQTYTFAPLSKTWAKTKARKTGNADMFWYYTGLLHKSIHASPLGPFEYNVGIRSTKGVDKKDPSVYAYFVETGKQKGGKARPLFFYTFRDFKQVWNANCKVFHEKMRRVAGR